MQQEDIGDTELMVHARASGRPPARNEDLAIITIDPVPGNPLNFSVVREVLRNFL